MRGRLTAGLRAAPKGGNQRAPNSALLAPFAEWDWEPVGARERTTAAPSWRSSELQRALLTTSWYKKGDACWPGLFCDASPVPGLSGLQGTEPPREQHCWGGWGHFARPFGKESGSVRGGKESSTGCAPSGSQDLSCSGTILCALRGRLLRIRSWEVRFGNTAPSITDMSSCSSEPPCLEGLVSIQMRCC